MVHREPEIDWSLRSVTCFKAGYSWHVLVPTLVREEQSPDLSSLWLSRCLFSSSHWLQLWMLPIDWFCVFKMCWPGRRGTWISIKWSLACWNFCILAACIWVKPPGILCFSLMRDLEGEGWSLWFLKGIHDWKMGQQGLLLCKPAPLIGKVIIGQLKVRPPQPGSWHLKASWGFLKKLFRTA